MNRVRNFELAPWFVLAVFAVLGGFHLICAQDAESAESNSASEASVWSFQMWCIEMEMLSSERCREQRAEDVANYRAYVARAERFRRDIPPPVIGEAGNCESRLGRPGSLVLRCPN
jgi:hypothetical protein